MKRLIFGLLFYFCIINNAFAALPATTVWEVRPANGSDTNGACYDSGGVGTDYSQQDAAQLSLTDLAQSLSSTTLTSATGGFTSAMVDNCIRISAAGTGPFTLGYYEITAFTDGNTVTLDRTACSTAGCSGGTGAVGGATASFEGPATNDLSDSIDDGHIVWVKNEAWNEAVTLTVAALSGAPITIEGYNTARSDDPVNGNMPRNNRAAAAGVGFNISAAGYRIKRIWVSNAGTNGFANSASSVSTYWFCRASNNAQDGFFSQGFFIGVESFSNTSDGLQAPSAGNFYFDGVYFHDNTAKGLNASSATIFAINSIFEANASDGIISTTAIMTLNGLTIDGNTGAASDGWESSTTGLNSSLLNSILSNNGNYGTNATDGDSTSADWNNYDTNTAGARNNFPTGDNDQALASTFTNSAGGDFSIGTNLKALGFPGAFPGATSTGYLDIGAVQRQEPAGGASSYGSIN